MVLPWFTLQASFWPMMHCDWPNHALQAITIYVSGTHVTPVELNMLHKS
jgi:hypothetical protein